ncbi:MAG TPA: cyclic nucleotide-binding domain-containing protein [Vicinamibacterales bacterium]|nr:cyclic nucleotide-binding domain-containing protein [Vicinamibacterales bacterium]
MTMTTEAELLHGLSPDAARAIVALGSRLVLPAGGVLFTLGSDADRLFLIERGRVSLTLPIQVEGREVDLLVEEKVTGQVVGWSALIPPHRFTLKACAPFEVELLAIERQALVEHFAAHPEVAYTVTRSIAAVVGQRLQVFQAMWLRQMQRALEMHAV